MKSCKIMSVKKIGVEQTYNVTMKSKQHNYKIVDIDGKGVYTANSHSAAYAYIGYQTAYLKVYYPMEYMCNLLTSQIFNSDQNVTLNKYINDAKKMGIKTFASHINRSGLEFKIDKVDNVEVIRLPLTIIKGVGGKAVQNIVDNQPYTDLKDFMVKVDHRVVNIKVFTELVNRGCMDCWQKTRPQLLKEHAEIKKDIEKEKKLIKKIQDKKSKDEGSLFDEEKTDEDLDKKDFDFSGNDLNI